MVKLNRYRCNSCGNLTRFTVTMIERVSAFHHFDLAGNVKLEEVEVLEQTVELVVCRWCGSRGGMIQLLAENKEAPD